ncbi:1-deoxy-D-xylulose-5-phosphate synthase [mine drainage metagenome]|uniref:1-deoxy-D-xylulose-5-phosphate synthase n=1 Tax=mine drainage metagenome TaxID=410659 RepID=A0A1J5QRK4_9ZZZZ
MLARHGDLAGLRGGHGPRVLVVGIGPMAETALDVAELLAQHGVASTVADPRWVLPVQPALVKLVGEHDHVVTIEDGLVDGGIGALLAQRASEAGHRVPVQSFGIPQEFLAHASREQVVAAVRLRPADVARDVLAVLSPGE